MISGPDMPEPVVKWCGRLSYAAGFAKQEAIWFRHRAGEIADTLLLLEHDDVYTIGRSADRSSLGGSPEELPAPVVETGRGGKATWHGPGQLIGYPILNLVRYGMDLHKYLRALETGIIEGSRALGVMADRADERTGVWVGSRKLASIGVGARHWITLHGFAINICVDLAGFDAIIPCGIQGVIMTSLEREGAVGMTVFDAARHYAPYLLQAVATIRAAP